MRRLLVLISILCSLTLPTNYAQEPAKKAPEQKPTVIELDEGTSQQLAQLAQAISDNEAVYKDAQLKLAQANAVIAQYESLVNKYSSVYFMALASAKKTPDECRPSADRRSIQCSPPKSDK